MRVWAVLAMLVAVGACGRGVPPDARVVVAGDSVMAWNRVQGGSVADHLARLLDEPVGDVSLPFARVTGDRPGGMDIRRQVDGLAPDWIVLNGGANDLRAECGCTGCDAVLDRLLSADGGAGAIAGMVGQLRADGARVLWADYYTAPRFAGTACTGPYDVLSQRLRRMAARDDGVVLVDMADVLPSGDAALFAWDGVHPSGEGSRRIAELIAARLRAADPALYGG
ncbi:SGNH/GDSL hydrolase family protein [Thalassococcus sp. CAU 1522]|uniref:SGNH/GDSL hydrolase family protein n=1 Tax=Thalassococcus arenae TaxID=2851652 RepID=A0ABS6N4C1_9RHOB|nr:SGNH/GDSL hydrolase family protein [Thalassococcus arenae]MBV2358863.1 SGNH/GDSL hydrolase family protein [Thalassococcus arenae]